MSEVIRCEACQGRKIIVGLGAMERECVVCRGIGFIEQEEEKVNSVESFPVEQMKVKRKYTRKVLDA